MNYLKKLFLFSSIMITTSAYSKVSLVLYGKCLLNTSCQNTANVNGSTISIVMDTYNNANSKLKKVF